MREIVKGVIIGAGIVGVIAGAVGMFVGRFICPDCSKVLARAQQHGIPKSDAQRAVSHYGIAESEYLSHPAYYPLPPAGTRRGEL